jgi:hypothetical protein
MATVASWGEAQLHGPHRWPLDSPRQLGAARARPARVHHVLDARSPPRSASSTHSAARGSMTRRRIIGDEVYSIAISTTPATHRYTGTYMRLSEKGCSPVRQSGRRQMTVLMVEMTSKSMKVLLAWLPSYTHAPRTLGKALPATRSDKESSHRWRAGVTRVIRDGWRRSGSMIMTHWAKQPQRLGD